MSKKECKNVVRDYRRFLEDLRAQLGAVRVLERNFFQVDELCELSVRDDVTVCDGNKGRVSIVDECLASQQRQAYMSLRKAVRDLDTMLVDGVGCFSQVREVEDGGSE